MSLRQLNTFNLTGNDDIDAIEEVLNAAYKGRERVSLTNMNNTSIPAIAAGSVIEVNGAIFVADADESISGSPSDGDIYIKLIPAGDPVSVTAEFTSTAPVWDSEKQGWYSSVSGEENYRFIGGCTKLGSSYLGKFIYVGYFKMPQKYQHKHSYQNISMGEVYHQSGTLSFIFTYDYIVDAIQFILPQITQTAFANYYNSHEGDQYGSVVEANVSIDSITVNNNLVTVVVRYSLIQPKDESGNTFRVSCAASIVGR